MNAKEAIRQNIDMANTICQSYLGDLTDSELLVRPVPGAAQHRTPLPGLFLCGAGCHPGGGVMGTAGRNAAQRILNPAGET